MLRGKALCQITALLVLIFPLSVSAIEIEQERPSEKKEAIQSTIDIKFNRHEPYERVIFYGTQELINSGKVRHKGNEVSVTFPDSEFSLNEDKVHLSFRREKDKIIFQRENIERIRVLNLSNPIRLAIDFYITKADLEQGDVSHTEKNEDLVSIGINARIAGVVEKVLQVLDNKEQKLGISEEASHIEKNKDLASNAVNTRIAGVVEKVLQVLDNKEQKLGISEEASHIEKNKDLASKEVNTRIAGVVEKVLLVLDKRAQKVASQVLEISVMKSTSAVAVTDLVKSQEAAESAGYALKIKEINKRIALLPFDNFSGNHEALGKIMPLILNQLQESGYDVMDYDEVEAFLCERRVRNSSFLSRKVAMEFAKNKMVNTAIAGSVLTFSTDGNPIIGIVARRIDLKTGHIIWSDFVSLTGEDFTRVLGLGTIKSMDMLIPNALNNLFATFNNISSAKDSSAKYKIAVLPFKNESKHRHAGDIITHLFQNELANNPMFDPVDYGDVKESIVNLRVWKKGEVDYNNLQALSKSMGVDVVLTGTVEKYQSGREYSSPPIVTISARLLDSNRNRIVWYENIQLDGEENIIALDWGRLRSADKVAYGAVSGLVNNIKTEGLLQ